MKRILVVALVMIMMLSFAGCGNGNVNIGSSKISVDNEESFIGSYKELGDGDALILKDDNTAIYIIGVLRRDLTWKKTDKNIEFYDDDNTCRGFAEFVDGGCVFQYDDGRNGKRIYFLEKVN